MASHISSLGALPDLANPTMLCEICGATESKYKCPKCSIHYCSLPCFKNEQHVHDNEEPTPKPAPQAEAPAADEEPKSLFDKIIEDDVVQLFLKYDALQFHLTTICQILNNTNGILEKDVGNNQATIANLKLQDLRSGGINENELVEEFVQRVLYLSNQHEST